MDGHLILHDARIKKNLGFEELNAQTSLRAAVLRKIDEGRFDELPPGLYARAYVRSFAAAVGLDPDETVKAVEHLLPGAPDPLPVIRELKGPDMSDRFASLINRVKKRETAQPSPARTNTEDREELEGEAVPLWQSYGPRMGAALIDGVVLLTMNLALVLLVALGTGIAPSMLVKHGSGALGTLCAVPTVLYFIFFNGIAGRTAGRRLFGLSDSPQNAPLTLDAILRRSVSPGDVEKRTGVRSYLSPIRFRHSA